MQPGLMREGKRTPDSAAVRRPDEAGLLLQYWLVWVGTHFLLAIGWSVVRSPSRDTVAMLLITSLLRLPAVGLVPALLGVAHLAAARVSMRHRRHVPGTFALGLVFGLLASVAVSRLFGVRLGGGLLVECVLPSVIAAAVIARSRTEPCSQTRPRVASSLPIVVISAAVGGAVVFWGLLLLDMLMHRFGNLTGLLEAFLAVPGACVGGAAGWVLSRREQTRAVRNAVFATCAILVVGLGSYWAFLLNSTPAPPETHSLDKRQEEAAATVRALQGSVRVDPSRLEKPVVEVNLSRTSVTDADLSVLTAFPSLEAVSLDSPRVSDAGLAHLRGLRELRSVSLTGSQVRGHGLVQLTSAPRLTVLALGGSKLTDEGFARAAALKSLRFLVLAHTGVTDAALAHLGGMKRLNDLTLSGTRITDAGLKKLEALTELRVLRVEGTQVTYAGRRRLQAKLPLLRINPP